MRYFSVIAAFLACLFATSAYAANVGVSVQLGEPGFYGRIDIGGYPHPQVIYAQPMAVMPVPVGHPPIYLRVPAGYERHWSRHCQEFNACHERVYFVRDRGYTHEYVPRYREKHHHHRIDRRKEHRGHDKGDHQRDHGRDRGHGRD